MEAIYNFADALLIRVQLALYYFFKKEDGDTNFISIVIVLAIAVAVAAIFMGFKDQILGWVNDTFDVAFGQFS